MADVQKQQLTEEERIERKLKMRKMLSTIFIVVAAVSIVSFIVLMLLTKQNVDTQTTFDTQEMRSKLKQIISLERRYYEENGELVEIKYLALSKELDRYNPSIDGYFKYKFDPKTGLATGMEKDASYDVNGDEDGRDGLTLSINWEADISEGSDFFWPEEDLADFEQNRAEQPVIEIGSDEE